MAISLTSGTQCNHCFSASHCVSCMQSTQCFVAKLKEQDVNFEVLHSRLFKSGSHVFRHGDIIEAIYMVKSGTFKAYLTTPCGEQVTSFYVPGDVIEFENINASRHEYSVMALEMSSVCVLPIAQFQRRMALVLPTWLIQYTTEKLKQEMFNRNILSKKSANAQVAAFLLNISKQKKQAGLSSVEFILPMTREDIANYLGLASETISRTLSRMQKCGLVKLNKRSVVLLDIPHLHSLANNHELHLQ